MIEISETFSPDSIPTLIDRLAIDKVNCDDLSYALFHRKYMTGNVPVVIQSIPQKWKSMQTWIKTTDESNITLDFNCLKQQIPNHKVPIADCTKKHLNSHEKIEMNFHDFLDYWASQMTSKAMCDNKLWYLKDWHLKKVQPSYDFYDVPEYFRSDWLNEYLNGTEQDDYRFVYMGPKGTW